MRCHRVFAAFIISLSVLTCWTQNVCAFDTKEVENLISRFQQETKCKSVSVVVYENKEATFYGDRNLYQIGSMTKAFTGLAVEKLINDALLDEDGIVSDYIPGFEAYYDSSKVDITVRNLLEQKSGYTNSEKDYPSATKSMTLSGWADSISGLSLKSRPGEEYAYSNVNYDLLGLIIENVSGMSYRDYMEKEILRPLGLKSTSVGFPEGGKIVEGTRLGFRHAFDFPMDVKEACIPAGYFYSGIEDMGRWIGIWTGNADIPESLKEPLSKVKGYLKNEGDYYSGWELFADGVIGHSGGTANYSSRIVFDEKRQIGVCVLTNLNVAATTDSLCNNIFDIVSGKAVEGLSSDIWTIFDKIFTGVTLAGAVLLLVVLFSGKRKLLIIVDVVLVLILVSIFIVFPMIFGAGMKEIVFTWAPWSIAGGLLAVAAVIAVSTVRALKVKKHE